MEEDQSQPEGAFRVIDNAYSLTSLLPGKYRVVAIDNLETGNYAPGDRGEMMKAFHAGAQEIEVREGDRIVKDLKVIGEEDIHVQAKQ